MHSLTSNIWKHSTLELWQTGLFAHIAVWPKSDMIIYTWEHFSVRWSDVGVNVLMTVKTGTSVIRQCRQWWCEIWGSNSSDCEEYCLLRYYATYSGRSLLMFQRNVLSPFHGQIESEARSSRQQACLAYSLILEMEVLRSSETSVNFYQTIWCNIPEDSNLLNTALA
jgi:hypothetical protein